MGPNEESLKAIAQQGDWRAPALASLEAALAPLTRALADLAQLDPDKWSGAAADQATATFAELQSRYRKLELTIHQVRAAVDSANQARARAIEMLGDLPSNKVPSAVHHAVDAAKVAGKVNVVIGGVSILAEKAVSIYEGWLGDNREDEAYQALMTLQQELEPEQQKLAAGRETIAKIARYLELDDDSRKKSSPTDWPQPTPVVRRGPQPVVPIPDPRSGVEPIVGPGVPPPSGHFPPGTPGIPGVPSLPGPYPGDGPIRTPGDPTGPWPSPSPHPSPTPSPNPGDPGAGPGDPTTPYVPGRGPDVDSGSAGTIRSPGLTAGVLGGGALAGGAALRWGSGAKVGGAQGLATGGSGGAGGVGGLLGTGGAGNAGAGGVAGGRGLAAGLPGGGTGASGGPGSGAGAGSGSGAATRGGMVGGGGMGGVTGGSNKKGQKSGLGGHIAPTLEDYEDFTPQSESARAGSRDKKC